MPNAATPQYDTAWALASEIPGWLTEAQAALLWDTARQLSGRPLVVEIGSHQGRSTVMLAAAVRDVGGEVVAVDPFVDGRMFGGSATRAIFEQNLTNAGLTESVELVPEYSTRALLGWTRQIDGLYIDGKHDYWTASNDLKWTSHMPPGSPALVHDCYSSIGVTLAILAHVLPSRTLTYERRVGSLALFRVEPPTFADRMRILAEVPWWLRNVVIKVLLRLRLRWVAARVFGHRGPYDPY